MSDDHLAARPRFETQEEFKARWLATTTIGDCLDRSWGIGLCCSTCGFEAGPGSHTYLDRARLEGFPRAMTLAALVKNAVWPDGCGHRGAWANSIADGHGAAPNPLPKTPSA